MIRYIAASCRGSDANTTLLLLLLLLITIMMMMRVSVTSLLFILSIYYSAAWTHVQRQGLCAILSFIRHLILRDLYIHILVVGLHALYALYAEAKN